MSGNLDNYSVEELQNEINKRNMKIASWYEFCQNNSGGSFIEDDKVTHRIFIQAMSLKDAISKSEELGVYFNGCDSGIDCSCCGDRWNEPYKTLEFPVDRVFNNIEEYAQHGYELACHYMRIPRHGESYIDHNDVVTMMEESTPSIGKRIIVSKPPTTPEYRYWF